MPFTEQLFGIAAAIDEGGIENIAAPFPEGIEEDRPRGKRLEILKAQRHRRSLLLEARNIALRNNARVGPELAIVQGVDAVGEFFD
ncbi:hypothetical protein D3C87_1907040 [compost metagenome]